MPMYEFSIPTKISIDSIESGFERLLNLRKQTILIVCSENRMKQKGTLGFSKYLEKLKVENEVILIDRKIENPTVKLLHEELSRLSFPIQYVISIGGGSSIDLAKGIVALSYLKETEGENLSSKKVEESIISKDYLRFPSEIKHIAIPTTAGTGSEMTSWATIWNPSQSEKLSIDTPWLTPESAIIIPQLTVSLSKRLTLSTGLDALSHAAESYWSKKSTVITRELSRIGIQQIVQALPKVLREPDYLEYRTQMCQGVIFASMAFANTRTAACHSISYPLTMRYGIEHGFAVAVTLAEVMKENQNEIQEWDKLLQAFGKSSIQEVENWIKELCEPVQKLHLKSMGVLKEDIQQIAEQSFTAGRMDNNIAEFNQDKVEKILNACYEDKG